jgi:16S rRNA (guanine966-N2)-methyltransferase
LTQLRFDVFSRSKMRIIAGSAGGIRLKIPSYDLRPSMDMVREATFSALGDMIVGARVLDLFAGSGAYGIEALSRGAAEAVFVDNHPKSVEAIRLNLSKARLAGKVIRSDVFQFLKAENTSYRVVFADPPYPKNAEDRDFTAELMETESLVAALEPGGLLILECPLAQEKTFFRFWDIRREKRYGTTTLLFCTHKTFPS